jgi:hypothetical protein
MRFTAEAQRTQIGFKHGNTELTEEKKQNP